MTELTRAAVERALARPIERRGDGYGCRICERTFPSKTPVGVHELVHRRAVGLAPPPRNGSQPKRPTSIVCGYDGCRARVVSSTLASHLKGKIHGLSRDEASFAARRRFDELAGAESSPPLPVVVATNGDEPEPSLWRDVDAVDVAVRLLASARSDELMPVRLLPSVADWIGHTHELLGELRRLTP